MARIASLLLVAAVAGLVGCGGKPDPTSPPAPTASPEPPGPTAPPTTSPKPPATEPTPKPPTAESGSVRGAIAHPGKKGQKLSVGFVGLTSEASDLIPFDIPAADEQLKVESPRKSALAFDQAGTTYEFPGLAAGGYLVFARLDGGPAAWAKVVVKAGGELTQDLKLETGKGGTVEVTLPADYEGDVLLAPSDLIPADDTTFVGGRVASHLELGAKAAKGKATLADVPPGKYAVYAIPGQPIPRGTVEVTSGKTAAVEIMTDKK